MGQSLKNDDTLGRVKSNDINSNLPAAINGVVGRRAYSTIDSLFRSQVKANHMSARKAYRQIKTLNGPTLTSTPATFVICGDQIARITFRNAYSLERDVVLDMMRDVRLCNEMLTFTDSDRIMIEVQYQMQSTKDSNVIRYAMKFEGESGWMIKLDHDEGFTDFSLNTTNYRYVLQDACRIIVYAPLINDEMMYKKLRKVKRRIRETLQKTLIHNAENPDQEILDLDLNNFFTKPEAYTNENLQNRSEEEKMGIVWEMRDRKGHFEQPRPKEFDWKLQQCNQNEENTREADLQSGMSYNEHSYKEAMEWF